MAEGGGEEQTAGAHTRMPDVFISYASQDTAVANAIVEILEGNDLRCWIAPRDVTPGSHYADGIMSAISGAKALVLVLSGSALTSKHVGKEVERASSKGRPIIAIHTDAAPLTPAFEYFLSESQWIDVGAGGLAALAAKLVEAVRSQAGSTVPTDPVAGRIVAGRSETVPLRRWMIPAMVAVIAVFVGYLGYLVVDKFWLSNHATSERPIAAVTPAATPAASAISEKSIAVLPFADMSEKKDQEFFADGMTEEIIDLLAKVPDLRVPARTSSFYFKGKPMKIPDIARELGVAHVLEGSIRRAGNQIRVTAQLVRADNGYHLWSETYDRDLHDVFKVQDEIADAVVQALQITLMGGPLTRQKGGTQNLEAYQLYLRSLSARRQNTRPSLEAERGYLEQAIKLDPVFALAWTGLANNTMLAVNNGIQLPIEGTERARQQAQHALQLSPDLAEAHAVLQYIHCSYDWDWAAAEAEGRQALALDPTNTGVLVYAGICSATLGHWDAAETQLRLALVRDPLATYPMFDLGSVLYRAGRYSDAAASYRKLQEIAPDFLWTRAYAAKNLLAEGKPDAALAMVQQDPDEESRLESLSIMLQAAGHQAEADEALKALIGKYAESSAYFVAMTYAYRNDHDSALQWLERAYRQKDSSLIEIVGEPLFKSLASDARYKAFLRKMNLPVRDDVAD